ncbi:MAG TPA: hypothetical protein VNA26_06610, partial [Chitinophagaceae bacterium]|nr:hypothetical protein [Chitinophagaceae bacterium]
MRKNLFFANITKLSTLVIGLFIVVKSEAQITTGQQLKMSDFAVYSGYTKVYDSSNYLLSIGSNVKVNGGHIGSHSKITSMDNVTITGSIFSGNTIRIGENLVVEGNVTANNKNNVAGTIVSGGKSQFKGNITVNGNIAISPAG